MIIWSLKYSSTKDTLSAKICKIHLVVVKITRPFLYTKDVLVPTKELLCFQKKSLPDCRWRQSMHFLDYRQTYGSTQSPPACALLRTDHKARRWWLRFCPRRSSDQSGRTRASPPTRTCCANWSLSPVVPASMPLPAIIASDSSPVSAVNSTGAKVVRRGSLLRNENNHSVLATESWCHPDRALAAPSGSNQTAPCTFWFSSSYKARFVRRRFPSSPPRHSSGRFLLAGAYLAAPARYHQEIFFFTFARIVKNLFISCGVVGRPRLMRMLFFARAES